MAKQKNTKANQTNVEFEELTSTENFFEKNKNIFVYGGIGIIVLILGFIVYQKFISEPKDIESQEQVWNALYDFQNDSLEIAAQGSGEYAGFEEIASEYEGTSGGDIANYSMGIIEMERENYEAAIDYFKNTDVEDVIIGTLSIGLQGDCYIELGDYETAVDYFEKAANREPNDFTSPMFLMKAGLAYEELGQYNDAVRVYTKIKEEYATTAEGQDIEKYITRATK
ncbi:MAG TPA: tetratricopeptide repeat protein [Crocinitomix sp.]|nr:tetratricopeptide repeat protein [Crocinitomix sp.]